MDSRHSSRMSGCPHVEQLERLAAPHFTNDNSIRTRAHRAPNQIPKRHSSRRAKRHVIVSATLQFGCILEYYDSFAREEVGDLSEERVRESRLAGIRAAGDQDVAMREHSMLEL